MGIEDWAGTLLISELKVNLIGAASSRELEESSGSVIGVDVAGSGQDQNRLWSGDWRRGCGFERIGSGRRRA